MADIKEGQSEEVVVVEDDDGLTELIDAELPPKEEPVTTPPDGDGGSDEQHKADDDEKPHVEEPAGSNSDDDNGVIEPAVTDDEEDESKSEGDEAPTFKYKGKEYKVSELETNPELRAKVFTSAEQQTHYQSLHDKTQVTIAEQAKQIAELRNIEVQRQNAAAQAQDQNAQPTIKPEQITAAYGDAVKGMVDEGWIEDDINTLYPNAVAGVVSMRDELMVRVGQLESALGKVLSGQQQTVAKTAHQTVSSKLTGIFDSLADEGGIFAPLKSKETQDKFLAKVSRELNPEIGSLINDPKILRSLWIAANPDALAAQVEAKYQKQVQDAADKLTEQNRRNAAGEGGGTTRVSAPAGGNAPAPGEEDGWSDL